MRATQTKEPKHDGQNLLSFHVPAGEGVFSIIATLYISITLSNKPCQYQNINYWADDTSRGMGPVIAIAM